MSRWIVLALALVGLGFAGSSAWVHYRLLTDPTYVSPCDVSATFNCSQVYMSAYGSFQGVSTALFGLFWFALVAALAAFAPTSEGRKSPVGAYIFALSTIGLAVVLYLGYASFVVLGTGCLLCMGTYVAVIGIFITSGLSASSGIGALPGRLFRDLKAVFDDPATLTVAVLLLAGSASVVAFFPKEGQTSAAAPASAMPGDAVAEFTAAWNAQSRRDLGVDPEGAAVVVVKFVDWQCPSCKAAHFTYEPIYQKYAESHPGAIREIIRDYPLNGACNYTMGVGGHISACEAAAAVRMAREAGREKDMINFFFSHPNQQGITAEEVKAETERMLGITNFDERYRELLPDIRQDTADAAALSVRSTPTYFVNGVLAQTQTGWLPAQLFDLALKIELEKSDRQ